MSFIWRRSFERRETEDETNNDLEHDWREKDVEAGSHVRNFWSRGQLKSRTCQLLQNNDGVFEAGMACGLV